MHVNLSTVLPVAAFVASILLFMNGKARTWAIVATIASGLMLSVALRLVRFSIVGVSLNVVLGAALAVAGGFLYTQVARKHHVAAATVLVLVGVIVLLTGLRIL